MPFLEKIESKPKYWRSCHRKRTIIYMIIAGGTSRVHPFTTQQNICLPQHRLLCTNLSDLQIHRSGAIILLFCILQVRNLSSWHSWNQVKYVSLLLSKIRRLVTLQWFESSISLKDSSSQLSYLRRHKSMRTIQTFMFASNGELNIISTLLCTILHHRTATSYLFSILDR